MVPASPGLDYERGASRLLQHLHLGPGDPAVAMPEPGGWACQPAHSGGRTLPHRDPLEPAAASTDGQLREHIGLSAPALWWRPWTRQSKRSTSCTPLWTSQATPAPRPPGAVHWHLRSPDENCTRTNLVWRCTPHHPRGPVCLLTGRPSWATVPMDFACGLYPVHMLLVSHPVFPSPVCAFMLCAISLVLDSAWFDWIYGLPYQWVALHLLSLLLCMTMDLL